MGGGLWDDGRIRGKAMVAIPTMDEEIPARDAPQVDQLPGLIARMADGDQKALERLYDLTIGKTFAVALRIVRDRGAAEEVVEDTYWQAWREAARFDAARGRPLAWLLTICRSRALDALRRADPAQPTEEVESLHDAVAEPDPDPLDLLQALQRGSAIRSAVNELKPQARQLVALAFFRGLTHQEIADFSALPLGTVKTTLYRACQQLKTCLTQLGWEPHHD
jgi:RNA polymerase sigma factor (sigma-70 family)